jgi:hypothetical protein
LATRNASGTSSSVTSITVNVPLPAGQVSGTVISSTTVRLSAIVSIPPALPVRQGLQRLKGSAKVEIRKSIGPDIWVDVACQVVSARATWGSNKSRGILSQADAGTLELELYDPDRILDPTNTASQFYGILRPGTWIRLVFDNGGTRFVIRSGYIDSLTHTVSTKTGNIRANDWVSLLSNFGFPNEFLGWNNEAQYTTLHGFAAGIIQQAWNSSFAAGFKPPVTIETDAGVVIYARSNSYTPGSIGPSVWDQISNHALSQLYFGWLDTNDVIRFRDSTYGHQPGISLGVSGPLPLDFIAAIDAGGIYNSIYVPLAGDNAQWTGFDAESAKSVFQWGTKRYTSPPIPSNGRFTQVQYGQAIWQDRNQPAFEALPVRIWPASISEFQQLISLEAMQLVVMQFDSVTPAINLVGRSIGEVINVDSDGWSVELSTWIPR